MVETRIGERSVEIISYITVLSARLSRVKHKPVIMNLSTILYPQTAYHVSTITIDIIQHSNQRQF